MDAPLFLDVTDVPGNGKTTWVETQDGLQLRMGIWNGDGRGTVVIFTGRGEYLEKYGRVIWQLTARGFSTVVFDWRGQGLSTRFGGHAAPGYVGTYADYQRDVYAILNHPEVLALPRPLHLLSHSMGGLIASRSLHAGLDAKTAIFSAPMWGMGLSAPVKTVLKYVASTSERTGITKQRVWGTKAVPYITDTTFEKNSLTGDRATFNWIRTQLSRHPELGLGGPSWAWLNQSHLETAAVRDLDTPKIPVLALIGTNETVVNTDAIRQRMATVDKGRLVTVADARHEVFMETPKILEKVWAEIDSFLSLNSSV